MQIVINLRCGRSREESARIHRAALEKKTRSEKRMRTALGNPFVTPPKKT